MTPNCFKMGDFKKQIPPLVNKHQLFHYITTKCAAFWVPRRGRVVVPSLSFKSRLLRASRSLEFQRRYCFPHAYASFHASPILPPWASLEHIARNRPRDLGTRLIGPPRHNGRPSGMPLVKSETQIRGSISNPGAGRPHSYQYHLSQHFQDTHPLKRCCL